MSSKTTRILSLFILSAFFLLGTPGHGEDRKVIEGILGRAGTSIGNGLQLDFPRTDLNVLAQGIPLDPPGMLDSQISFFPEAKGMRLEGRILVLGLEVSRALVQAVRNGFQVTALDSPFGDTSPQIRCLHLVGEGAPKKMAWAAKMVLDSTGTPMGPMSLEPRTLEKKDPWQEIQKVFGPGTKKGETLLYKWVKKGRAELDKGELRVALQKEGKYLWIWGEYLIPKDEITHWSPKVLQNHFQVTALTQPMERDLLSRIDFISVDEEGPILGTLKVLLDQEGFGPGPPK